MNTKTLFSCPIKRLAGSVLSVLLFAVAVFLCSPLSGHAQSEQLITEAFASNTDGSHLFALSLDQHDQSASDKVCPLLVVDTAGRFHLPAARGSEPFPPCQVTFENLTPSSQPSARASKLSANPQFHVAGCVLSARTELVLPQQAISPPADVVDSFPRLLPSARGLVAFPTPPPHRC